MLIPTMLAVTGAWLIASAFLWPHETGQFNNAWMTGVLVMGTAVVEFMGQERGRRVATALAVWLFVSNLLLTTGLQTAWNHALVAVGLFLVSVVPPRTVGRRTAFPARA